MSKRVSLVAYLERKVKKFERRQAQKSPYLVFFVQNLRRATLLYLGLLIVDFIVAIAKHHHQSLIHSLMGFHVEIISRNSLVYCYFIDSNRTTSKEKIMIFLKLKYPPVSLSWLMGGIFNLVK